MCHIKVLPRFSTATAGNRWSLTLVGGGLLGLNLAPTFLFLVSSLFFRQRCPSLCIFTSSAHPSSSPHSHSHTHSHAHTKYHVKDIQTAARMLLSAILHPTALCFISTKQKQVAHVHMSNGVGRAFSENTAATSLISRGEKWLIFSWHVHTLTPELCLPFWPMNAWMH